MISSWKKSDNYENTGRNKNRGFGRSKPKKQDHPHEYNAYTAKNGDLVIAEVTVTHSDTTFGKKNVNIGETAHISEVKIYRVKSKEVIKDFKFHIEKLQLEHENFFFKKVKFKDNDFNFKLLDKWL